MNTISFDEFSRIRFQTVALKTQVEEGSEGTSKTGVLAILNASNVGQVFIKFSDAMGHESYCAADVPIGSSLSIGNDLKHVKPQELDFDIISKLVLTIAKVITCTVRKQDFSSEFEAHVLLDFGTGNSLVSYIPGVSEELSLVGKKIIVWTNLQKECLWDANVHVLCGIRSGSDIWYPFEATNQEIATGTRAIFS